MPHQLHPLTEQKENWKDKYFTCHIFSPYHFGTDGKQNLIQKFVNPLKSMKAGREGEMWDWGVKL